MSRRIKILKPENVAPCPKCSNREEFVVHSNQCAEDCCEVWAVCKCGFDPTEEHTDYRLEDVWGGVGDDNCAAAVDCWNDAIVGLFGGEA